MYRFIILLCGMFAATLTQAQTDNNLAVQTRLKTGLIEGNYDVQTGIQYFLGVPFAKPPVGALRWKAPQPLEPWGGVKITKAFGPRAVQGLVFGDMKSRSAGVSEDCLYLNVWSPAKRNEKGLPVLVYFYGGGFVAGDGAEPRYDGESMAKKGIVTVTVNYRLGLFGFFAHPVLSAESPYKASGNYGLLDQAAALKWVKDNIAAFGGDPQKVTIAGESAGSISVSYQMASPLSKNLIAGAIGESGAGIYPTLAPVSLKDAETTGSDFVEKAGYSFEDFRKLPTKDLFELYQQSKRFGFPVVLDQYFLPATLPELFAKKQQAQIPLLLGWNSAEMGGAGFMMGQPYTKEAYQKRVEQEYPQDVRTVMELYPAGNEKEIERSATALASDRFIVYSTWKWADLHTNNSSQPVYRYLYSKLQPSMVDVNTAMGLAGGMVKADPDKRPVPIGAPHACEIEYCMGNLHLIPDYAWTEDDYTVSAVMQEYFANFIKTGNPNGGGLPNWPTIKRGDVSPYIINIDVDTKSEKAIYDDRYRFLDKKFGNDKFK